MKIYRLKDGEIYEGEPVDCRELLATGSYSITEPVEAVEPVPFDQPVAVVEDFPVRKRKGSVG